MMDLQYLLSKLPVQAPGQPGQRAPPGHPVVPPSIASGSSCGMRKSNTWKAPSFPSLHFCNFVQGQGGNQDHLCRAQVLQLCWAPLTATSSLLFPCISWHGTTSASSSRASVEMLIREHATIRERASWVWTFRSKATLCHQAVRALVKHHLCSEGMWDVFEEIMGHGPHRGRGKLFSLLEHFELCLEGKHTGALKPAGMGVCAGKPWETTRSQGVSWYLFPTYLTQTEEVSEVWGGDHPKDLHIHAYFSPEIPEGFFQR